MSTKAQLIATLAESTGNTKRASAAMIDTVLYTVKNQLLSGGVVTLPGIGKFRLDERSARQGRNPRTGEALRIEGKKVVKFRPSAAMKRAANQ